MVNEDDLVWRVFYKLIRSESLEDKNVARTLYKKEFLTRIIHESIINPTSLTETFFEILDNEKQT